MKDSWQLASTRTVDLDHEQLLILEGRPRTRVKVIYGGVWLTADGDIKDHFPSSGEEVAITARRRSIIESLGRTRVEVIEPVRYSYMRRLADAMRRWLRLPSSAMGVD